jgi:phospholipid transport system substrate-binding protein
VLTLLAVLLISVTALASGPSPTEFVRTQATATARILEQPDTPKRAESLNTLVHQTVDFRELASRSLGAHWTGRTPEEQQEFLDLLQELLQVNYTNRLAGRRLDQDYTIEYGRERIRNERAIVDATVKVKKETHPVSFRLQRRGESWIAYDIVIDDISLEETYRDGYVPIIEEDGWPALIKLMRERLAELKANKK